jgi:hypothetical protein
VQDFDKLLVRYDATQGRAEEWRVDPGRYDFACRDREQPGTCRHYPIMSVVAVDASTDPLAARRELKSIRVLELRREIVVEIGRQRVGTFEGPREDA